MLKFSRILLPSCLLPWKTGFKFEPINSKPASALTNSNPKLRITRQHLQVNIRFNDLDLADLLTGSFRRLQRCSLCIVLVKVLSRPITTLPLFRDNLLPFCVPVDVTFVWVSSRNLIAIVQLGMEDEGRLNTNSCLEFWEAYEVAFYVRRESICTDSNQCHQNEAGCCFRWAKWLHFEWR